MAGKGVANWVRFIIFRGSHVFGSLVPWATHGGVIRPWRPKACGKYDGIWSFGIATSTGSPPINAGAVAINIKLVVILGELMVL